ncbi:unnamed protein product, partial [Aphanomyces euteiches]
MTETDVSAWLLALPFATFVTCEASTWMTLFTSHTWETSLLHFILVIPSPLLS